MLPEEELNLACARRYIEVVSNPASTAEDLKAFFDQNMVWREMPNRFAPSGRWSDYEKALASFGKSREYVPEQSYRLRHAVASAETVALELTWSGEVAQAIGPFEAGTRLRAEVAIFLRFRDGKIVSQTDYVCYDQSAGAAD